MQHIVSAHNSHEGKAVGVKLLPTYQLRPLESEKFSSVRARLVIEQILASNLHGKSYDDGYVTQWGENIASAVKAGVKGVLPNASNTAGDGYSRAHSPGCSRYFHIRDKNFDLHLGSSVLIYRDGGGNQVYLPLTAFITYMTETQNIPRIKLLVQVAIGEKRGQSVRIASLCLWDPATDNYASAAFTNVCIIRHLRLSDDWLVL